MNTKQLSVWKEIVQQCKSRFFGRINVASNVRSDAILAADALVKLVTPDLPDLLEQLAKYANLYDAPHSSYEARALAARIGEALEEKEVQLNGENKDSME